MQSIVWGENADRNNLKPWLLHAASLVTILFSSLLSALVFDADHVGSVIALCFVLPFLLVLYQWVAVARPITQQLIPVATLVSLLGVALEPGALNIALTWALLAAMAVMSRSVEAASPLAVLSGLLRDTLTSPVTIAKDAQQGTKFGLAQTSHIPRPSPSSWLLPLVAVSVFTLLLAAANPVIENALLALNLEGLFLEIDLFLQAILSFAGLVFVLTAVLLWAILRGNSQLRATALDDDSKVPFWHRAFFKPGAVSVTLIALNALFAVENILDIGHVWMNAALPKGLNHAEYVHRGAYTLIVTANLAALLMIFALWKGTATEKSTLVRGLVMAWILQNLMLVASSMKRTMSYIEAYDWTEWRLAGLLWMGLVFFGLLTIMWRVIKHRNSYWLINTNLIAATALLLVCAVVDMRGFIATQNLSRALQFPEHQVDLQYLEALGSSSIVPLQRYKLQLQNKIDGAVRPDHGGNTQHQLMRAEWTVSLLQSRLHIQNTDWRSWTWRFAGADNPKRP